ncbi:hypothetical protein N9733_00260 [Akkermansiaceae bacterium]|nr:hypothetical protein [Akkermansiaceae bacterium]
MSAIKIISTESEPDFQNLWTLGRPIGTDWFDEHQPQQPTFLCAVDATRLYFLAGDKNHPKYHPEGKPSSFQPELWKYDVAEFFLASPDGSSYLEFNLSPNGAWWSARFAGAKPRIPLDLPPLAGVETAGEITEEGWQVRASIPLSELGPLEGSLLNVTFILGSPDQRFFTSAPLGATEPDFHCPSHFLPMSLPSRGDARQTQS